MFLIYVNDFHLCSDFFEFNLFADDASLFCEDTKLSSLRTTINSELDKVYHWLCANKLFLNIDKSNYVICQPYQRQTIPQLDFRIAQTSLKRSSCIKYLGLYVDSSLSWKDHIDYVCKKVKRSIGVLSKLRQFVTTTVLKTLYYSLVYPFLIYGITVWGNTYQTTLNPLYILQKKVVRVITFENFDAPSSPKFKCLSILKLPDLVTLYVSIFMHKFHQQLLPSVFNNFFADVRDMHTYDTRFAAKHSYYVPKIRTNFGKFSIRYQGPKVWNFLEKNIKSYSVSLFKKNMKQNLLDCY